MQEIKYSSEQYLAGETLTVAQVTTAVNEFMNAICGMGFGYIDDVIASKCYKKDTWYDLPATCISISEVNIDKCGNPITLNYRLDGNRILFGDTDKYIIHYRRLPAEVSALSGTTGTIELHQAYKTAIVKYVIAWYRLSDEEGDSQEGINKQQEALTLAQSVNKQLSKGRLKEIVVNRR